MPKRTSDIADLEQGTSKSQAVGQETARPGQVDDEMGEFEDRWEDEIESEEEIEEIERDAGDDDDVDGDMGEFVSREEQSESWTTLQQHMPSGGTWTGPRLTVYRVPPRAGRRGGGRDRKTTRDVPPRRQVGRGRTIGPRSIGLPRPSLLILRLALPLVRCLAR